MKFPTSLRPWIATLAILGSPLVAGSSAQAQLYWDSNSTTLGAGATPNGTWGVDNFWNTDPTGGAAGTFQIGTLITSDVFFSAGNDAVNAYAVGLNSATQNARLVTFKDGTATLSTGTLSLGNLGGITVTDGTVTGATISSGLTISGSQIFNVAAGRTLTLDTGTFTRNAGATLNVLSTGTVTTTMTGLDSASMVNGIVGPWAFFGTGTATQYATVSGGNIAGFTGTAENNQANWTDDTANYEVTAGATLNGNRTMNTLRSSVAGNSTINLNGSSRTLTLNGILAVGASGALTISGNATNQLLAGSTGEIVIAGPQNVTISAPITSGAVTYSGTGVLTLSGANTYAGGFTRNSGTLASFTTGTYAGFGSGTVTVNGGGNWSFTTSANVTFNNDMVWNQSTMTFFRNSSGTPVANWNGDITLGTNVTTTTSAATFSFNHNYNGNISDGGNGYGLTFSGGNTGTKPVYVLNGTNSYTGLTSINNGTLIMTKPSSIGGVTVASGQSFIYAPTTAGALNLDGALTLGGSTIGTALESTLSQSVIASTGAAALSGTGVVEVRPGSGVTPAVGTHNLITAASGLDGGTYTLRVLGNTNYTVSNFTRTGTEISVDVAAATALSGDVYWKGGLSGATGVWSASNGSTQSNWQVTDGVNQPLAPGATTDLVFSTATTPGTMVGMTLGADMSVRTLTINNTATAFGLNNDALNSTLTITPSSATTGITIGSGVQAVTINAPLVLGAAQTWTNNSSNNFNLNAAVTMGGDLIIDGSGNTILNAAAVIGGTGNLIKNGSGNLHHGGASPAHNFTGNVIVNGGSIGSQGQSWLTGRNVQLTDGYIGGRFNSGFTWTGGLGTGANQIQITGGTSGFSGEGNSNSTFQIGAASSVLKWGATGENGATGFFNPTVFLANGTANMNTNGKGTLNNGIDLNGATRTITSTQTTNNVFNSGFTISGVISNTAGTAAGLTKTGVGNLILGSANTFNGVTTISDGFLTLTNALGLQNSALDTTNSIAGSATAGLRVRTTTMTIGGLIGNKNFAATGGVFTTAADSVYGTVTALTLNVAAAENLTYSGNIENGAAGMTLTKTGAGTQTLSGTNTYTGATTVNGGTLVVNGSLAAGSAVTVNTGGTLAGDGLISGNIIANGSIAPGNSIGILEVGGSLTWNGSAVNEWVFELGPGNTADLVDVTGAFTRGTGISGTDFVFDFAGSTATGTFVLVDFGSTDFDVADFSYDSLGGGNTGSFNLTGTQLQFIAVPEPGTLALLASGVALLGLRLTRRRKA